MITTRARVVVLIGAFLYVSVMAFAGGVAAERIRFDRQRAAVLQRHEEALQQWHQFLMAAEQRKVEAGSAAGDAVQVVW
jgi:sensor domain CHASE-containing protein